MAFFTKAIGLDDLDTHCQAYQQQQRTPEGKSDPFCTKSIGFWLQETSKVLRVKSDPFCTKRIGFWLVETGLSCKPVVHAC